MASFRVPGPLAVAAFNSGEKYLKDAYFKPYGTAASHGFAPGPVAQKLTAGSSKDPRPSRIAERREKRESLRLAVLEYANERETQFDEWENTLIAIGRAYRQAYKNVNKAVAESTESQALTDAMLLGVITAVCAGAFSWVGFLTASAASAAAERAAIAVTSAQEAATFLEASSLRAQTYVRAVRSARDTAEHTGQRGPSLIEAMRLRNEITGQATRANHAVAAARVQLTAAQHALTVRNLSTNFVFPAFSTLLGEVIDIYQDEIPALPAIVSGDPDDVRDDLQTRVNDERIRIGSFLTSVSDSLRNADLRRFDLVTTDTEAGIRAVLEAWGLVASALPTRSDLPTASDMQDEFERGLWAKWVIENRSVTRGYRSANGDDDDDDDGEAVVELTSPSFMQGRWFGDEVFAQFRALGIVRPEQPQYDLRGHESFSTARHILNWALHYHSRALDSL